MTMSASMGDGSGPAKGPQINPKALETTIERLNRTPYLYNSRGNIYYFAIGSNMLKSKLLNRGLGNTTIDIISMESGVAKNYRLAFNLRSFPPTEPSMASIEPAEGIDCHGGLVEMTVDNYHKLFLSEGGGRVPSSYVEEIVEVYPYNNERNSNTTTSSVLAIAFRASEWARLAQDWSPSSRYLNIITTGAKELGLHHSYLTWLESIQPYRTSLILSYLSQYNTKGLIFLAKLLQKEPYVLVRPWSRYIAYTISAPSSSTGTHKLYYEIVSCIVMLPLALLGAIMSAIFIVLRIPEPTIFGSSAPQKKA